MPTGGISPFDTDVPERNQVTEPPIPPLTGALRLTLPPLQSVVGETDIVPHVGWATTVTTALPVISLAIAVQVASLSAVTVYVVVNVGFTAII